MNKTSTIVVTAAMANALANVITKKKSGSETEKDHLRKSLKRASESFGSFKRDIVKEATNLMNDDKMRQKVTILNINRIREAIKEVEPQIEQVNLENNEGNDDEIRVLNASLVNECTEAFAIIDENDNSEENIALFDCLNNQSYYVGNTLVKDDVFLIEDDINKQPRIMRDQILQKVSECEAVVIDVVRTIPHTTIKYKPMDEFDLTFFIDALLDNKTISVVKPPREVFFEPKSDFDIKSFINILLKNKTISVIKPPKEVFFEPMNDFDITFYKNILLKGKYIKPIIDYTPIKVKYVPIDDFDISFYINILLEGKTITPINTPPIYQPIKQGIPSIVDVEQDNNYHEGSIDNGEIKYINVQPVIIEEAIIHYEPIDDFDVSFYINELTFGKEIQVVKEENKPEVINKFVEEIKDNKLDELVKEIKNSIEENNSNDSIDDLLNEIEKNNYEEDSSKIERTNIQTYLINYPYLSERKIRSIQENILLMIQSLQPYTIATIVHVIGFESESNLKEYAQEYSNQYNITINDDELLITETIEITEKVLVKRILQLASDVSKFKGKYRGWKVDSAF